MRKRRSATWNANHPSADARLALASQVRAERAARLADPTTDTRMAAAQARMAAMDTAPLARSNQAFSLFRA